ncbi:hypothetical protein PHET_09793 [Paragonimus heterotremus]|uniref:Uncharacterized protein n=1 Tax=Paragonimus heterotremus TaxID=100268 RepID=A0A8J4WUE1_9TREM|nr:hypothetical protein PHET_09793 [Paragonimus heterotremus]
MKYEQLGVWQDLSLAVHLILTLTVTCVSVITQNITLNSVGVNFSQRAYSNMKTRCLAILITQCILLIIELVLSVLKLDRWYLKSSLSQTLFCILFCYRCSHGGISFPVGIFRCFGFATFERTICPDSGSTIYHTIHRLVSCSCQSKMKGQIYRLGTPFHLLRFTAVLDSYARSSYVSQCCLKFL